jgi:ATP-dependent DNA ligase
MAPSATVVTSGSWTRDRLDDGRLEGIALKDRTARYRDGSRAGWAKVKDRNWYEREAWWFDRR